MIIQGCKLQEQIVIEHKTKTYTVVRYIDMKITLIRIKKAESEVRYDTNQRERNSALLLNIPF